MKIWLKSGKQPHLCNVFVLVKVERQDTHVIQLWGWQSMLWGWLWWGRPVQDSSVSLLENYLKYILSSFQWIETKISFMFLSFQWTVTLNPAPRRLFSFPSRSGCPSLECTRKKAPRYSQSGFLRPREKVREHTRFYLAWSEVSQSLTGTEAKV